MSALNIMTQYKYTFDNPTTFAREILDDQGTVVEFISAEQLSTLEPTFRHGMFYAEDILCESFDKVLHIVKTRVDEFWNGQSIQPLV